MKFIIYALVDPRTGEIRYIGKSSSGVRRPRLHTAPSHLKEERTHKANWVRLLLSLGLKPGIQILEEFSSETDLNDAECFWIAQGRGLGWRLTNATKGGEGATGCVISEETRARMCRAQTTSQKPDPALVERARQLYVEEKKGSTLVARLLGVTSTTILKWAHKGDWLRPPKEQHLDPTLVERARQLYVDEKKSVTEVAKTLGRSHVSIWEWAHKGGWARSRRKTLQLSASPKESFLTP